MPAAALSVPFFALLMTAAASAFAPSQPPPSPPAAAEPNTIIVTGSRLNRRAIRNYVQGVTVDTDGQIAMFEQPICPASFGLPDAYNRIIEHRLREDAARVGLRTAGEPCDANVIVIVADSPGPLVAELQRNRPDVFAGLEFSQIQDILKTKEPVRTWQAIEPHGSDGRPLERVIMLDGTHIGGPNGAWLNPAMANSRIQQSIKPTLVSSFVVMSTDAVDGLTLTQIADYAAMRTLARTRSTAGLNHRSILELIDGAEQDRTVDQLTAWDLAYLKALYRTSNGVSAHMQQSDIASVMKNEFDTDAASNTTDVHRR